nr:DALR anticodon-binding domain-containing protein [Brevibacterium renqingii]
MTTDSSSHGASEYSVRVTPEDLQTALARALTLAESGLVAPGAADGPIDVVAPRRPENGDWSTTAALRAAAHPSGRKALAEHICDHLLTLPEVAAADTADPGFVNISLTPTARARAAIDAACALQPPRGPWSNAGSGPWSDAAVDPNVIGALQLRHAAACRERRRARAAGITTDEADSSTLDHPSEARLLNALAALPGAVDRSRRLRRAAPLVTGLSDVADAVEEWLSRCAVTPTIDEDITARHSARLVLVRAAIIVLAAGLRQLGAAAPERI